MEINMHKIRKEKVMTQVGRPQSENKKMTAVNISLPQAMLDAIQAQADSIGESKGMIVRAAIRQMFATQQLQQQGVNDG